MTNYKTILFILIASLLFILGFILTWIGQYKMDEYIKKPAEWYTYEINVEPREEIKQLNNAYIQQDFSSNKGEFSFATNESVYIGEVNMQLPNNVTNIECYNKSRNDFSNKEKLIELKCNITENINGYVKIEFDRKFFSNEKIVVTYSIHVLPNNLFEILTYQTWYGGKEGNFIIKLGKNYECIADCLYDPVNVDKITWSGTAKDIPLTFRNYEEKTQHFFKIITKSRKILDNKNFNVSLGVSLMTGSIFFILSLLFYIYSQSKEENKLIKGFH